MIRRNGYDGGDDEFRYEQEGDQQGRHQHEAGNEPAECEMR